MSPRQSDQPPSSGLSLSQIVASAAAASSAAFAASYLGVAGTIIGAAVASVIATVASSMYAASLRHSRAAVRRTAGQFGATWVVRAPGPAPEEEDDGGIRWSRVLAATAAVLVLTLGTLTSVEAVFGKPLSTLLGGSDDTGTSLSAVTGGGGSAKAPTHQAPVEKQTPTPEPTQEPSPTEEPTTEPTPTPTAEPTDEPTAEPTDEPTAEPTDGATATPTP